MLRFFIPSKTFLLGEYAVLRGGPALLAATTPEFIVTCKKTSTGLTWPGAGDFESDPDSYKPIEFIDPHEGRGGFGASSAQFLAKYLSARWNGLGGEVPTWSDPTLITEMVRFYRNCSGQSQNPPSGADVAGQVLGRLAIVDLEKRRFEQQKWPWPDLGFCLVRTGTKVATHVHLNGELRFRHEGLVLASRLGIESLSRGDQVSFLEAVREFSQVLEAEGFCHPGTLEKLRVIRNFNGVLAAKGCGALGADVLAIFAKRDAISEIRKLLQKLNLSIEAEDKDLSPGLRWEIKS